MPLTDTAIRRAKPADKPMKLFDGRGLFLQIAPAGGKWWRFRYRFGGKHKTVKDVHGSSPCAGVFSC